MKKGISDRYDNDWKQAKIDFISDYKFTIACENSFSNSYRTEKIVQPFVANSIPIYIGAPNIAKEFNPKAFINCSEYKNFDEVIAKVVELDTDDEKYMEMLRQPAMQPDYKFDIQERFENFLYNIIEKGNKPFNKNPRSWDYNEKLMRDIVDIKKIRFKYNRYKILSKIALGKYHEYYINRFRGYTPYAQRVENLITKLKTIK